MQRSIRLPSTHIAIHRARMAPDEEACCSQGAEILFWGAAMSTAATPYTPETVARILVKRICDGVAENRWSRAQTAAFDAARVRTKKMLLAYTSCESQHWKNPLRVVLRKPSPR